MRRDELIRKFPVLYHMAEDGTWPAIKTHGLLSTTALVDLFEPDESTRVEILTQVRRSSVTLEHPQHGIAVVRDQRPLKFLDQCLLPDTTPQQFLDALNGRVFFWLSANRLHRLLGAAMYRNRVHTVLHVDTAELLERHGDTVQLAPYNTGSMHVPNAPARGANVFVDLDEYAYETWAKKRGQGMEAVVELTVPYSVPQIEQVTVRVERWKGGTPVSTLFDRSATLS